MIDDEYEAEIDEAVGAQPARRGFSFEQMIACEVCLRANPPTRLNCLYCGAQLPATAASAALQLPTLRRLEEWERGFNVIHLPSGQIDLAATRLNEAAAVLRLEGEQLKGILAAGLRLPLARAAAPEEAALIERRLAALGLRTETVSDEELMVETHAPLRLRRLEIAEETLRGWAKAEADSVAVAWQDITLLVAGRLYTKRLEVEERRGRGAEKEIVESREMLEDEGVLDIYAAGREGNWRIAASGFDFSCLGQRKSLLATENFRALVALCRARAAAAAYDDDYWRVRHLLAPVWPLAERTEARGLRRTRPGRFHTEAYLIMSNEAQFARYSRLRHYQLNQ